MIKVFILEDNEERIAQFRKNFKNASLTITKESKNAIEILRKESPFDYIFLDHDLGGNEMVESGKGTGFEVAQWLSKNTLKKPKFGMYIHSLNGPGAENIIAELKYGQRVPFVWTKVVDFKA